MALLSELVLLRTIKDTVWRELEDTAREAVSQDKGTCGRNEHGRGRDYERVRACIFTKLSLMTLHNFFLVSLTRTGIDLGRCFGGFAHHKRRFSLCHGIPRLHHFDIHLFPHKHPALDWLLILWWTMSLRRNLVSVIPFVIHGRCKFGTRWASLSGEYNYF